MALSDFASIASVIGVLAVVVSLIYLNLQTRQNTRHAMAAIQQGRSNQISELILAMVADPSLVEAMSRGAAGDQAMSDVEARRYLLWNSAFSFNLEDQFHQYRSGLIDAQRFQGATASLKGLVTTPGWRAFWKTMDGRFSPDFHRWVDSVAAESAVRPPGDGVALWKALAADELAKSKA